MAEPDGGWSWPKLELYTPGGRSDIKTLTLNDLERLQAIAAAKPWSAIGRPRWVREHRDRIREVMLRVFVPEHPSVYRCYVTAILDDGSGGEFTLDVAFEEFDRLPDISLKRLVELAHGRLLLYPDIKLDPDQEETWTAFDS